MQNRREDMDFKINMTLLSTHIYVKFCSDAFKNKVFKNNLIACYFPIINKSNVK